MFLYQRKLSCQLGSASQRLGSRARSRRTKTQNSKLKSIMRPRRRLPSILQAPPSRQLKFRWSLRPHTTCVLVLVLVLNMFIEHIANACGRDFGKVTAIYIPYWLEYEFTINDICQYPNSMKYVFVFQLGIAQCCLRRSMFTVASAHV